MPSFTAYLLLGLSICAVWSPPIPLGGGRSVPPWVLLFLAAVACGLAGGVLDGQALPAIGLLAAAAHWSRRADSRRQRMAFAGVTALVALAMALHRVPGFHNAVVVEGLRFGIDGALPFTLRANFDKATAGLFLLVFFCHRIASVREGRALAPRAALTALAVTAVVLAAALATDLVVPDPKWPAFAPAFVAINLLFTCVAEEAFFRGLLQERLMRRFPARPMLAVGVSTVLFGLAHLGGGATYAAAATLAGAGYGVAYAHTRRIEVAVFTHFVVNMVCFFGFTVVASG
jgi:membrane protease YdiL (CAAX protease family)